MDTVLSNIYRYYNTFFRKLNSITPKKLDADPNQPSFRQARMVTPQPYDQTMYNYRYPTRGPLSVRIDPQPWNWTARVST